MSRVYMIYFYLIFCPLLKDLNPKSTLTYCSLSRSVSVCSDCLTRKLSEAKYDMSVQKADLNEIAISLLTSGNSQLTVFTGCQHWFKTSDADRSTVSVD